MRSTAPLRKTRAPQIAHNVVMALTNRTECLYAKINPGIYLPPNKLDSYLISICDTVPHFMDHKMVLDTLLYPTRSSVTTFRSFLRVTILAVSCSWPATALLFAAELFPYAPPSSSQQRSVEQ